MQLFAHGKQPRKCIFFREKKETKKIPKSQRLPKWGETLPDDVSHSFYAAVYSIVKSACSLLYLDFEESE